MGCFGSREQEEKSSDDESFFNYLNNNEGSLRAQEQYLIANQRTMSINLKSQLLDTNSSNYYVDSNIQSTYQSPREGINQQFNQEASKGILKKRFMLEQVRIQQQRVRFNIQSLRRSRYRSNSLIQ